MRAALGFLVVALILLSAELAVFQVQRGNYRFRRAVWLGIMTLIVVSWLFIGWHLLGN